MPAIDVKNEMTNAATGGNQISARIETFRKWSNGM